MSTDGELLAARDEICDGVGGLPASPARAALERFCAWWRGEDPLALEQVYVSTFDLDKRSGLYVTFYGEGDPLPNANAHGRQGTCSPQPLQLMHGSEYKARSAHTERMP